MPDNRAEVSQRGRSLAVGLVLYKPTELLVERIIAAHDQGYQIFVFDNSPEDGMVREALYGLSTTRYHTMGSNLGLGCGLASICASAFYEGHNALVFFDQDTVFTERTLEFVSGFLEERGPSVRATHSAIAFKSPGPKGEREDSQYSLNDVRLAISSGSLFFLENLRRVNWHNTKYFVDCVDYEFCLRSARYGLKVAECFGAPGFDHRSEQADTEFVVFGRSVFIRRYSRVRVRGTIAGSLRLMGVSLLSLRLGYFRELLRFLCSYTLRQMAARLLLRGKPSGP